jgi:hypothetical protein
MGLKSLRHGDIGFASKILNDDLGFSFAEREGDQETGQKLRREKSVDCDFPAFKRSLQPDGKKTALRPAVHSQLAERFFHQSHRS